jgi:hypothetical protein
MRLSQEDKQLYRQEVLKRRRQRYVQAARQVKAMWKRNGVRPSTAKKTRQGTLNKHQPWFKEVKRSGGADD